MNHRLAAIKKTQIKSVDTYMKIAGIILWIDIVVSIGITLFISIQREQNWFSYIDIIGYVLLGIFAYFIYRRKKDSSLLIASGAFLLWEVFTLYSYNYYYVYDAISDVLDGLAMISMLVIILFNSAKPLHKKAKSINNFWFVPGCMHFLIFNYFSVCNYSDSFLLSVINSFLLSFMLTIPFLLIGFWLKKSYLNLENSTVEKASTDVIFDPKMTGISQLRMPVVIGGAEQLKIYYELLNAGALTQEEYNQEKKRILG